MVRLAQPTLLLTPTENAGFSKIGGIPELQHRIGGYPDEIRERCMRLACEHAARGLADPVRGVEVPEAFERAAKSWRLLMQIDSDPQLKMQFGDGGRPYVFARQQHAARGGFSKTVRISQCY